MVRPLGLFANESDAVSGQVWVIVVAAGRGSRFGGPKQYEELAGRRVLDWSIDAARSVADGIVLVVPPWRAADNEPSASTWVAGGSTRSDSVRAGLAAVPADAEVVVVHDAARPLASAALFQAVVDAVRGGAVAVVPGVAVVDSIRHRDGQAIDRDELVAVQTPQAFDATVLREAHADRGEASDDATLVEQAGAAVTVVPGEPVNRKITDRADILSAAQHLIKES